MPNTEILTENYDTRPANEPTNFEIYLIRLNAQWFSNAGVNDLASVCFWNIGGFQWLT